MLLCIRKRKMVWSDLYPLTFSLLIGYFAEFRVNGSVSVMDGQKCMPIFFYSKTGSPCPNTAFSLQPVLFYLSRMVSCSLGGWYMSEPDKVRKNVKCPWKTQARTFPISWRNLQLAHRHAPRQLGSLDFPSPNIYVIRRVQERRRSLFSHCSSSMRF